MHVNVRFTRMPIGRREHIVTCHHDCARLKIALILEQLRQENGP
jgi:hypothetical protein